MIYSNSGVIGYQDGDIFVSLNANHHPTADYVRRLRKILPADFPGTTFSFLPADIISQILNFGSPAPIDVQVVGQNQKADSAYAIDLLRQMRSIPGIADPRIQQSPDNPQLNVNVEPLADRRIRPDRAQRHQQPRHLAGRQLADRPGLLARPQ